MHLQITSLKKKYRGKTEPCNRLTEIKVSENCRFSKIKNGDIDHDDKTKNNRLIENVDDKEMIHIP